MDTYLVTLEIKSETDVTQWDWPTLLDVPDPEHVRVISHEKWEVE